MNIKWIFLLIKLVILDIKIDRTTKWLSPMTWRRYFLLFGVYLLVYTLYAASAEL